MSTEISPNSQITVQHGASQEGERVPLEVPKGCAEALSALEECGSSICEGFSLVLMAPLKLLRRILSIFFPPKERYSEHDVVNRHLEKLADADLGLEEKWSSFAALLSIKNHDLTPEIEKALSFLTAEEAGTLFTTIETYLNRFRENPLALGESKQKLRDYLMLSSREQQQIFQAVFLKSQSS